MRNNLQNIYHDVIEGILYSKMSFFLKVDKSKILYRLSRDQNVLDTT